jgi:protein-tyrosine phosphatase
MELGYRKFITTPHIYWELYKNTNQTIEAAYQKLTTGLHEAQLSVDISYAAEYFLDDHFDELLASGEPMLTIKDNWVLVEFSFASPPLDLGDKLFELQIKGYQPVIAHPERYLFAGADKSFYEKLKDKGCYFQLNLLSSIGYYGKGPQELAQYLTKKGWYNLLGTDLHHHNHLTALRQPVLADISKKLMDTGLILNAGL